jgi:hypothetical protein
MAPICQVYKGDGLSLEKNHREILWNSSIDWPLKPSETPPTSTVKKPIQWGDGRWFPGRVQHKNVGWIMFHSPGRTKTRLWIAPSGSAENDQN